MSVSIRRLAAVQSSTWASLGKPQEAQFGQPFVSHNQVGRLKVFAIGQGALLYICHIAPNGGWADGR